MNNHKPLVSIVTPVYNGSKYLEELITSVLDQDYSSIEHIIIDDGSTDGGCTVDILKRYTHLRWWSRANRGAYATINEGLAASRGQLVTVICADDKYASSTSISSAVAFWSRCGECDAVYGDTIFIRPDGRPLDLEPPRSGPLWLFPYYPTVSHCSLVIKRSRIVDVGLWFDESLPVIADNDWIRKMIRAGYQFRRLRRPIAMFRVHPSQRGQNLSSRIVEETRRVTQRHGEPNVVISFMVRKWVAMIMLKNLLMRRGVWEGAREVLARRRVAKQGRNPWR